MDLATYLSFVLVSAGLIVMPGPNVLLIISTSIAHGKARGLQTVAGTSIAMCIQLAIAAFATSLYVEVIAEGFYYLKWLGVGYLCYLGLSHFYQACRDEEGRPKPSAAGTFGRGFWVSLTNPKTILFFSAFLPQFVSPAAPFLGQVLILSVTFLLLAALLDSCYAILSGKLQIMLANKRVGRIQQGLSGTLFLCASTWLATLRRT
jgi:threonine/homoserine/homoserine lactone efflux protein